MVPVITSIYGEMDKEHQKLMDDNQEHMKNMLDYAIMELVEIAENSDICLIDNLKICMTYEDIFECLKHRSQKRINHNK